MSWWEDVRIMYLEMFGKNEDIQEDGSVIMEIVKEYGNRTAVGNYLD